MKTVRILTIDRSKPFPKWQINLNSYYEVVEQDERLSKLTHLDVSKIQLKDGLRKGETFIYPEERIERLKESGYILLDGLFMLSVVMKKNLKLTPYSWRKPGEETMKIFCDGTHLFNSRYSDWLFLPYFQWEWGQYGVGHWKVDVCGFSKQPYMRSRRGRGTPSAVITLEDYQDATAEAP